MLFREQRAPSSKFMAYFQLLETFKQSGCPVCIKLEEGSLKALDGLMYEQVNDPFTRERLVASHGFCNWHAWMIPHVQSSALGAALIYRHLLEETLSHLVAARQGAHPRGFWQRLGKPLSRSREEQSGMLAWRRRKTRCYLCTFARRSERDDLKTILGHLGEAGFAEAFLHSSGLCLPHLTQAMTIGRDHPNLPVLLAAHERRWRDLSWELEEFARKFDYRYADEPKGRESGSWRRALETLAGRPGAFGPERGDWPPPQEPRPEGWVEAQTGSAQAASSEQPGEVECLRFENDRLRHHLEAALARQAEDRQSRLALEAQVLKLTSELKTTGTNLASGRGGGVPSGAEAQAGDLDGQTVDTEEGVSNR